LLAYVCRFIDGPNDQINVVKEKEGVMPEAFFWSKLRLYAVLLVLLTAAGPCGAENVFAIYGGTSFTRDSELRISQSGGADLSLHNVRWDADPFKAAPYYGLRYTHFLEKYPAWGIAVDYNHYKMYAKTGRIVTADGTWQGERIYASAPMDRYVQHFELSHGVNMLSLNGIYRWQDLDLLQGRLQPYVGVGLVHYWPHSENTVNGLSHETGYQPSGFGYELLGGLQYQIGERWGLFAEIKFNSGTAKVDIAGGDAETALRTFHALGGLQYRF
jgi:opacity protein-like surface antigen